MFSKNNSARLKELSFRRSQVRILSTASSLFHIVNCTIIAIHETTTPINCKHIYFSPIPYLELCGKTLASREIRNFVVSKNRPKKLQKAFFQSDLTIWPTTISDLSNFLSTSDLSRDFAECPMPWCQRQSQGSEATRDKRVCRTKASNRSHRRHRFHRHDQEFHSWRVERCFNRARKLKWLVPKSMKICWIITKSSEYCKHVDSNCCLWWAGTLHCYL